MDINFQKHGDLDWNKIPVVDTMCLSYKIK